MPDYLYSFLFVLALALPLLFIPLLWKRRKAGLASVSLYLISYLPLTLSGTDSISNHGGNDWRREWLPRFLMVEYTSPNGRSKTDLTITGAAYWPCILLDRLLWHRSAQTEV